MFDRLRVKLERRLVQLMGAANDNAAPSLVTDPALADALRKEGNAHLAAGLPKDAEACFRAGLIHAPNSVALLICLGYSLKEQSQLAQARIMLRRAARDGGEHPEVYEAYYLLGQISEQQNDWDDALRQYTAALEHNPRFVRACQDGLGMLMAANRKAEVPAFLEACIQRCPLEREYHLTLGRFWVDVSNNQGIVDCFTAALALGASLSDINLPMGQALLRLFRTDEATPYIERALVEEPNLRPYLDTVRGGHNGQLGNSAKAVELLESAIASKPDYAIAHSALLMILSYTKLGGDRAEYVNAAKRFAQIFETGTQFSYVASDYSHGAESIRPLRVGFVAGEFRHHPVLHFLLGVLENMPSGRVATIAFSNNVSDDSGTEIFKQVFDEWVDIRDLDDSAAANAVHTKDIDVLLDLCGHTGDGRLGMFARKPAPVQASWLGYWASTGLTTMDYLIADPYCVTDARSEWFSEALHVLPHTRLCMTAPRADKPIELTQPPSLRNGYVTFGSFQRTAKLNSDVLTLWGRVLRANPNARLRIQTDTAKSDHLRDALLVRIRDADIDISRVDLLPQTTADLYFAAYGEVDIILDTFPFTGGTTTAQALWMGVPTVTRVGTTMLSLQGVSMLTCAGLTDWIAETDEDYIRIASTFANSPQALTVLRSELRDTVLKSPLFDVATFAQDFTDALWTMYRHKQKQVASTSK